MIEDLSQQTALVTGATAGIGRATARAARGAGVIVHGRDKNRAADTLQQIGALGANVRFEPTDQAEAERPAFRRSRTRPYADGESPTCWTC